MFSAQSTSTAERSERTKENSLIARNVEDMCFLSIAVCLLKVFPVEEKAAQRESLTILVTFYGTQSCSKSIFSENASIPDAEQNEQSDGKYVFWHEETGLWPVYVSESSPVGN